MIAKTFLIRAGVTVAAGALASFGFTAAASASESDGWSWQRVDEASVGTAGGIGVQSDNGTSEAQPDGWSWW